MLLVTLLHFYQPYNQQADILARVVHECYEPVVSGFLLRPNCKAVFNISGSLIQLLAQQGYASLLDNFNTLVSRGQIELTGSSMHHAFLPLLPSSEVVRQITLNEAMLSEYFGLSAKPTGFFSPELAVNSQVVTSVSKLGYSWLAAPQVAYPKSSELDHTKLYTEETTGLSILFRNKRVSSLILSAITRTAPDLITETSDIITAQNYWFTVMDAETFGHHRIGHDKFLFDLLTHPQITTTTASDLLKIPLESEVIKLRPSTWTNEEQDFWLDKEKTQATTAKSFILWQDPENPIHKLQWDFVSLAIKAVTECLATKPQARLSLDKALASDQFWWASAKPWWSLEMLEQGAHSLKETIYLTQNQQYMKEADNLYAKIIEQAFSWQRTGYIRKKHLENSATFMKEPFKTRAPAEWYNQMILEFEDEMTKAATNRDYEKAIKWRDALIKLNQGSDIYDVLHVVDELWSARSIPQVKPFLAHTWEEFSEFAKGYFIDVPDKATFEAWKARKIQL